jgi:hypothetical protein
MNVGERIGEVLLAKADAVVRRDARALATLIHPDFVYVNAAGKSFDKAGYIDTYCSSGKIVFQAQKFSDLTVQLFPGTAVATLVAHDRFLVDGETIAATYQSLCVFIELDGRWQWVAGQTRTAG